MIKKIEGEILIKKIAKKPNKCVLVITKEQMIIPFLVQPKNLPKLISFNVGDKVIVYYTVTDNGFIFSSIELLNYYNQPIKNNSKT